MSMNSSGFSRGCRGSFCGGRLGLPFRPGSLWCQPTPGIKVGAVVADYPNRPRPPRFSYRRGVLPLRMTLHIGILFALLCAFVTNLGFLYKHRGASAAPPVDFSHPLRSAAGLFRSPWFAIGMLVAAGAWVFHVLALALAPMSVVQVVLAGGLVLLAVMADRLFGFTVGKRQWAGLAAMAIGIGLIAITQPAVHGSHSSYSVIAMVAFEGGLLAVGGLLIAGPRVMGARAE